MSAKWRGIALLGMLAVGILTAGAQIGGADFRGLLSGATHPLTLPIKNLTGEEWRQVSVGQSGPGAITYYTKGETTTVGGEAFLIAYRLASPTQARLVPDTALSLSLLNVRSIVSLSNVRPFRPDLLVAENEKTLAASLNNLRQLGAGLVLYVQEHDEVFPPMKDAATARKALRSYIRSESVFAQPETKRPYIPNAWLSGKSLAMMAKPGEIVAFYEADPAEDGMRGVAFADGSARRVSAEEWAGLPTAPPNP